MPSKKPQRKAARPKPAPKKAAAKNAAAPRVRPKAAPKQAAAKRLVPKSAPKAAPKTAPKAAPKTAPKPAPKPKLAARASAPATTPKAAPARTPSAIGLLNQHMDYTSHDTEGVRRFYTQVLGFTQFEHDPQMNYLMVKTGESSSLGFMPPMPGPPEEWRPPREPALYFMIEDVDRAHAALTAQGVSFDQAPQDMPWGHRVAALRDPEGRRVCLAQVLK